MKRQNRIPELLLGFAALALLVAILVPQHPASLPTPSLPAKRPAAATVADNADPARPVSPVETAQLFHPPITNADSPDKPKKASTPSVPQQAKNLHYVAFVVDKEGETLYFLKDTESGDMLLLSPKRSQDGWSLVSASDGSLVVERAGQKYVISRE